MPKVSVELPTGVKDEAELKKLLDTFVKQRITTKAKDKAVAAATKELKAKYADEFKALVAKHSKA